MGLFELITIALVQGVTEFLPVSSSAHLILTPIVADWKDQGLLIDVAAHCGTLGAVIVYWRRDVGRLIKGSFQLLRKSKGPDKRLFLFILIATIPVIIVGYFLASSGWAVRLRSVEIIAWTTIIFGLLLYIIDRISMTLNRIEHLTWLGAVFLGLAQVLALVPGTSRAGIVITAARFLGFERSESARISMLMSMPTLFAAGCFGVYQLLESEKLVLRQDAVWVAGLSFLAALASITLMMRWLRFSGYTPFVIYRLILGGGLLFWLYS